MFNFVCFHAYLPFQILEIVNYRIFKNFVKLNSVLYIIHLLDSNDIRRLRYVRFIPKRTTLYSGAYSRNNHVVTYCFGCGSSFIFKKVNDKVLNSMQGFAAGIMIAASFWSLLQPAIESSENSAMPWLPAAIGFILGGVLSGF